MSKMSFEAFDTRKIDEYAAEAKKSWGKTDAWKEYEQKSAGRSKEDEIALGIGIMDIFAELGKIKDGSPESEEAQALVMKLQNYITHHFYTCTDEILESLGQMYAGGDDMTRNIDKMGGEGTAVFANEAIEAYILAK